MNAWKKARTNQKQDYLGEWRKVAEAVDGITKSDPRFEPLMDLCDKAEMLTAKKQFAEFSAIVEKILDVRHPKPRVIEELGGEQQSLLGTGVR